MENTKRCTKCGMELPLECFSKDKSKKDGLFYWCKDCQKQYSKQWHAEHKEEKTAYMKQYRAEHTEYFKQWRDDHKEERAEYMKQLYQIHREEKLEYQKQYGTERYATLEGYAYKIRRTNLRNDRKYGRCGADEDILPPLEYYVWALQQPDFYDGKQYPFTEMGLDRIYNDKAHTFANVVPCSTKNNVRRGRKSFEEFCELMRKKMS